MENLDPKIELLVREIIQEERDKSDKKYAIKLVEVAFFGILAYVGYRILSVYLDVEVVKILFP